jgi:hypothetical protein
MTGLPLVGHGPAWWAAATPGASGRASENGLEISRQGYNAFVLRYRVDAATEDMAAAIAYVFRHAGRLGIGPAHYSLWGSSAGARMAAAIGSHGVARFGGGELPRPAAVVMAYTGHVEVASDEPPTGHHPRAVHGRPRRPAARLGALAHAASDAVEPSWLGCSPHWPVLTRPRLAGFQVSTEALHPPTGARALDHGPSRSERASSAIKPRRSTS